MPVERGTKFVKDFATENVAYDDHIRRKHWHYVSFKQTLTKETQIYCYNKGTMETGAEGKGQGTKTGQEQGDRDSRTETGGHT